MKCQSNIPKYEEFKFLNECQVQFDTLFESLKTAKKLYLETEALSKHTFELLVEADPSPTKKYLERMCKWWDSNIISIVLIRDYISMYDTLCNKNLIKEKDINSFKTYEDFKKFIKSKESIISKAEQKDKIKTKEADVILDDDKWFVVSPLTHSASCIFGAGTKWCTTMKDSTYWDSYTSKFVKFYYCLDKKEPKTSTMYKFAVAVYPDGTKECYDAKDENFEFSYIEKFGPPKDIFKPEIPKLEKIIHGWFSDKYIIDKEGFYSTEGDVEIKNWKEKQLPIKFKYVGGVFSCGNLHLETLEGCPEKTGRSFWCYANKLISLEFAPKIVGGNFWCYGNRKEFTEEDVKKVCKVNGKIHVS